MLVCAVAPHVGRHAGATDKQAIDAEFAKLPGRPDDGIAKSGVAISVRARLSLRISG